MTLSANYTMKKIRFSPLCIFTCAFSLVHFYLCIFTCAFSLVHFHLCIFTYLFVFCMGSPIRQYMVWSLERVRCRDAYDVLKWQTWASCLDISSEMYSDRPSDLQVKLALYSSASLLWSDLSLSSSHLSSELPWVLSCWKVVHYIHYGFYAYFSVLLCHQLTSSRLDTIFFRPFSLLYYYIEMVTNYLRWS